MHERFIYMHIFQYMHTGISEAFLDSGDNTVQEDIFSRVIPVKSY